MARLVRSIPAGKKKVYDVTVAVTHSFFAYSSRGNQEHAILVHNCHELSKQAMDAMLKPLEDNIRGSEEKQLICIFCTTEPNKMRPAIMSRCAPAFKIRQNTPEEIAARLEFICESEGVEYDGAVLPLIAEVCECHVRDSIKAVEGVSMLGKVDRENVNRYLHMDANGLYLDLLENLGRDISKVLATIEKLNEQVSPATCYERMADVSMLAYRLSNLGGTTVPSYWDRDRLAAVGDLHKEFLVEFAQTFAARPAYASVSMFACDVAALHQQRAGIVVTATQTVEVQVPTMLSVAPVATPEPVLPPSPVPALTTEPEPQEPVQVPEPSPAPMETAPVIEAPTPPIEPSPKPENVENASSTAKAQAHAGTIRSEPYINEVGVHINPQAQMSRGIDPRQGFNGVADPITVSEFSKTLHRRVIELTEEKSTSGRPARRDDVGSS